MQGLTKIKLTKLYQLDYLAWLETSLKQVKQRNLTDLDLAIIFYEYVTTTLEDSNFLNILGYNC